MNELSATPADPKIHRIQQAIKWTVYTLLIVNFIYYLYEDWDRAIHTLDAGSRFLDWTRDFANSIDESAWFILLFMFELETYVLEDEDWSGWIRHAVRGLRLICILAIAHTTFAYVTSIAELRPTVAVNDVTDLCDIVDGEIAYVYNLDYTVVDKQNCGNLSNAPQFFWIGDSAVVSDRAGLVLERRLAWVDLIENISWVLVLIAIEVVVRFQGRGITSGALFVAANRLKVVAYSTIMALGIYWAFLSHWLYLWDEILWIGGFAAIEMNITEWRAEILGRREANWS
jgi:hypothetical protein